MLCRCKPTVKIFPIKTADKKASFTPAFGTRQRIKFKVSGIRYHANAKQKWRGRKIHFTNKVYYILYISFFISFFPLAHTLRQIA